MFNKDALASLVENSGLSYKTSGASYIFTCPRCSKKDKLYIRKTDGLFICFYCAEKDNFKGKPEYALSELLGLTLKQVRDSLYGEDLNKDFEEKGVFLDLQLDEDVAEEVQPDFMSEPNYNFPDDFYPIEHAHSIRGMEYIVGRGIPEEVAIKYKLHYHPQSRRVIFPVYIGQNLKGWQARTILPTTFVNSKNEVVKIPKMLTNGVKHRNCFMFQNNIFNSEHAILCEGPIDAIKADLVGGNVASMGKNVSHKQLELFRYYGIKKLYIALDPDAAEEINKLMFDMSDLDIYNMVPPNSKDLGEMTFAEVKELFDSAQEVNASNLFIHLK